MAERYAGAVRRCSAPLAASRQSGPAIPFRVMEASFGVMVMVVNRGIARGAGVAVAALQNSSEILPRGNPAVDGWEEPACTDSEIGPIGLRPLGENAIARLCKGSTVPLRPRATAAS